MKIDFTAIEYLFDNAPIGIYQSTLSGRFVNMNNELARMLGYKSKQEAINSVRDIATDFYASPHDREKVLSEIANLNDTSSYEIKFKRKDGQLFDARLSIRTFNQIDQAEAHYIGIIENISKNKLAEIELQKSEEKFSLLFQNMNTAFAYHKIITNKKGEPTNYEYIEVNSMFEKLTSLKAKDIVGKKVLDVIPNLEPIWIKKFGEVALTGKSIEYTDYVKGLGKYYKAKAYSPQKGFFAVTFSDVTIEIESEKALKESEEMYRTIVELSPEGIITMTLAGKILTVNKSFLRLSGYEKDQFLGKHFLSIPTLIKQDIGVYGQLFSRIIKGDTGKPIEFKWKHKSGDIHYGEAHVAIIKKGKSRFVQGVIRDVTETKLAQNKLKQSEERFNLAMAAVNEGIFDWNIKNDSVFYDNRYYTMAGYKPNEFPHEFSEWVKRVHPDDIDQCMLQVQDHLKGKTQNFDIEFRFLKKDGNWMWIRGSGKIVERDSKGSPTRMIGTHSDITDRRVAEEALRAKSIELENYFSNALDLFCIADVEGNFVRVNKAWEETLGYSVAELEKRRFLEFVHPDDMQPTLDAVSKLKSQNQVLSFTNRYKSKDGGYRHIEWRSYPHGSLIFAAARDVTHRRQMMNKLIESQRMLRNVIDTIPVRVFWKDLEGRYLGCNNLFAKDAGRPNPESLIGDDDFSMGWADQAELYRADDKDVITRNEPKLNFEEPQTTPTGEKIWLKTSKVPLRDSNDKVVGLLGTYEDITEKKNLEVELLKHKENLEHIVKERTEELEAANEELTSINEELFYQRKELQATLEKLQNAQKQLVQSEKMASIGVLTSGIAHEINNPINFISSGVVGLDMEVKEIIEAINEYITCCQQLNNSEGLQIIERVDANHNVKKAINNIPKLINSIRTGVDRTTTIIKGLRTFSRLDEENKTIASLSEIINSALTILYNKYKHTITVNTRYAKDDTISCYPGKLGQLFLNLLINSIQAIKGEGTIDIYTELMEGKGAVKVVIKDTGVGIPKNIVSKIFDPFFTTKPVGEGTGLGLSIVHGIVNDHKGNIKVKSQVGKGTEILLYLPKS